MTNFRLFQTERGSRRQFQISYKWQKVLKTGRKQFWKGRNCSLRARRNCSLRAISPFPKVFAKHLYCMFGKRLRAGKNYKPYFKRRNRSLRAISYFTAMFSNCPMIYQALSPDGVHPQISSSLRFLVLCLVRPDMLVINNCLFILSKNSFLPVAPLTNATPAFSTL